MHTSNRNFRFRLVVSCSFLPLLSRNGRRDTSRSPRTRKTHWPRGERRNRSRRKTRTLSQPNGSRTDRQCYFTEGGKAEIARRPCPSSCVPKSQLRLKTGPPAEKRQAAALVLPWAQQAARACALSLAACSWRVWRALLLLPQRPSERRTALLLEDRPCALRFLL